MFKTNNISPRNKKTFGNHFLKYHLQNSFCGSAVMNLTRGQKELQCSLKMWLGSGIAVAVAVQAGSYSSNSTPNLGNPICHKCDLKKVKNKKNTIYNNILKTKHLGIKLTKYMQDLCTENYKSLVKEIPEKWREIQIL